MAVATVLMVAVRVSVMLVAMIVVLHRFTSARGMDCIRD